MIQIEIDERIIKAWDAIKDKYKKEIYSKFYFICGYKAGYNDRVGVTLYTARASFDGEFDCVESTHITIKGG